MVTWKLIFELPPGFIFPPSTFHTSTKALIVGKSLFWIQATVKLCHDDNVKPEKKFNSLWPRNTIKVSFRWCHADTRFREKRMFTQKKLHQSGRLVNTNPEPCLCVDEEFGGVLRCSPSSFEDVGLCHRIISASLFYLSYLSSHQEELDHFLSYLSSHQEELDHFQQRTWNGRNSYRSLPPDL